MQVAKSVTDRVRESKTKSVKGIHRHGRPAGRARGKDGSVKAEISIPGKAENDAGLNAKDRKGLGKSVLYLKGLAFLEMSLKTARSW